MEIGGCDIVIALTNSINIEDIKKILVKAWPQLIVESDHENGYFIHKNAESAKSWENDGLTETNDSEMIYAIFGNSQLTLVIDSEKKLLPLIDEIRNFVQGT